MGRFGFIVVERFTPEGPSWAKYTAWSKLGHLKEVVSLDTCLCPAVVQTLLDDDWPHVLRLYGDAQIWGALLFDDLEWTERRIPTTPETQLLSVVREPSEAEIGTPPRGDFEFMGFDLVEDESGISALVNCGGFDDVLLGSELSPQGLIRDSRRAREIQDELRRRYPDEPHADCARWAIWRKCPT